MIETSRLVITRKRNESFTIGDDITITLGEQRGNQVRVIIDAPKNVLIKRDNIKKDINKNIIKEPLEQAEKEGSL